VVHAVLHTACGQRSQLVVALGYQPNRGSPHDEFPLPQRRTPGGRV